MVKVIANGQVIAESDSTVIVEGNHYFPPESIKKDLFKPSNTTLGNQTIAFYLSLTILLHSTHCPWKGSVNHWFDLKGRLQ